MRFFDEDKEYIEAINIIIQELQGDILQEDLV